MLFDSACYGMSSYKVVRVKGEVKVWEPWRASWKVLNSADKIIKNSLVLVTENSSLTYLSASTDKDAPNEITISTPLAFRVDGNEIKKIKIIHHEIASMPDFSGITPTSDTSPLLTSMTDAWNRAVVTVKGGKMPKQIRRENKEKMSSKIRNRYNLDLNDNILEIVSPSNKKIISVNRFPHSIKVFWKVKNDINFRKFYIYFWRNGEKPLLVATADHPKYQIKIPAYGDYFVQIRGEFTDISAKIYLEESSTIALQVIHTTYAILSPKSPIQVFLNQ